METKRTKRGRPPKEAGRRKDEYLDIRLSPSEKQSFRDAADVAGLDLSAWVRERLRTLARKELEAVGRLVNFSHEKGTGAAPVAESKKATKSKRSSGRKARSGMPAPPEHLAEATMHGQELHLQFTSGLATSIPIVDVTDPAKLKLATLRALSDGTGISVQTKKGESIVIDSAALRCLVDKEYEAKVRASIRALQMTPEEMDQFSADNPLPPEFFALPKDDARQEF